MMGFSSPSLRGAYAPRRLYGFGAWQGYDKRTLSCSLAPPLTPMLSWVRPAAESVPISERPSNQRDSATLAAKM